MIREKYSAVGRKTCGNALAFASLESCSNNIARNIGSLVAFIMHEKHERIHKDLENYEILKKSPALPVLLAYRIAHMVS